MTHALPDRSRPAPSTTIPGFIYALAIFALVAGSCATRCEPLSAKLPPELREASGLAVAGENLLVAHHDESAALYIIDLTTLTVIARSGAPDYPGDFEGVAVAPEGLYLSTSAGDLFRFTVTRSGEAPPSYRMSQKIPTGLGPLCEFEGLAATDGLLLLPCKKPIARGDDDMLRIYSYAPAEGRARSFLSLPRSRVPGAKTFRPTAIEVDGRTLYILSNRQLITVDRESLDSHVYKLSKKRHPKPEGLTVLADGRLVIVDDRKKKKTHITIYASVDELREVRD